MRIVTVCRMNQARSPFAQAVLERNFPEDQISSTGVTAIDGTPILDAVVEIAKNWRIPITQSVSKSLSKASADIQSADLIITAEDLQSDVIRNLGYQGVLRSYEEIVEDKDFVPIDPVGLLAGLAQTRKQGYAYAPTGVVPGSRALAVPIRLLDGKTVAGLAIATITERLPKDRVQTIVRHLTERAELIGTQLQELTRRKNERSS